MTEVLITIAAIAFVALVVTLIVRARTKQKEEAANALSMREAAANRTREQLESISAMSNGASRMKPKAPSRPASSSRHSAPSRSHVSRTRRDDDDIITNPLHPLNPITDPVGLYERDEPVRETRSEPSYSAPEPSYSEPERSSSVSSPGSYSFGGSSDSGSSYSSSSDSGSSYSSSDSSSGGSFD
ncbi:cell division protein [Vibrio phage VH1_2019]|uniref:Cell division protein n=1 Tax=Vibrio phage VH1_2019 TaxID=2686307 RepID=A0A6B9SWS6_9CAUD|nr:cell division protein [Vibrio phage VH1_2019]